MCGRRVPRWKVLTAIGAAVLVAAAIVTALVVTNSSSITSTSSASVVAITSTTTGELKTFMIATPTGATTLQNRDSVTVQFELTSGATELNNWVGVYCVANASAAHDVAVGDYIDYRYTYNKTSGSLTFGPMINMRCVWQFRFVTQDNTVLATSALLTMANGDAEPLQIHLAVTNDATQMRVGWTSAKVSNPVVVYGSDKTSLSKIGKANTTTYGADDMCGWIASTVSTTHYRDPGYMFDALMTDLVPGTSYFYRVGEQDGLLSDVRTFVVPPRAGTAPDDDKSMSFFVFGDLAATASATDEYEVAGSCGTTMKLIEADIESGAHNYVAVMHDGDLSYAKGSTFLWDQFGFLIERVASKVAYLVSIGNHDYGYLEGHALNATKYPANPLLEGAGETGWQANGECGVPTLKRFHMPENGNEAFWYSTDMGLAHHSVITAEMDFSVNSSMYNWLKQDLAGVDRSKTPWVFLHIHRPMYCSADYPQDYNITLQIREQMEPLAVQYGVNVVFSGHYHSYERTCAVVDGACVEASSNGGETNAPIHIMVGSGGAYVDSAAYMDVSWSEKHIQQYGYGRMHIYNASHANFEFVRNKDGQVADSIWIQASATLGKGNGKITTGSGSSSSSDSSALSTVYVVVIIAASVVVFLVTAFFITRTWRKKPSGAKPSSTKNFHKMEDVV